MKGEKHTDCWLDPCGILNGDIPRFVRKRTYKGLSYNFGEWIWNMEIRWERREEDNF